LLETFFQRSFAIRRLRRGPLAEYIDLLADRLAAQGYSRVHSRIQLRHIGHFNRWLEQKDLTAAQIDEEIIEGPKTRAGAASPGRDLYRREHAREHVEAGPDLASVALAVFAAEGLRCDLLAHAASIAETSACGEPISRARAGGPPPCRHARARRGPAGPRSPVRAGPSHP